MPTMTYWVRCIRVQKPVPYETSVWDSSKASAKPAPDPTVAGAATFVFIPDYDNSSPETHGFTLAVDPNPPGDISQAQTATSGATLEIVDNCKLLGDVNLNLRSMFQGQGYVVNGGKPTIRNRPATMPPPRIRVLRMVVYALIALAVIYAIYKYSHFF
jgi:hypothetical protein